MKRVVLIVMVIGGGVALLARGEPSAPPAAPATKPAAVMPPAVAREVDFVKDVVPIFQQSCINCHSSGKTEADLSVETKARLLEGGAAGPAIVPGDSANSLLTQLVSGMDPDPDRYMPKKGKKLTPEQIGLLRAWIDQGAKWPQDFVVADPSKPIPAKLEPRNVPIPAAHDGLTNPIDLLLAPYFEQHKITPANVVDDRLFARRVYLDIIGLLPPPGDLEEFASNTNPDKRKILVEKLLADDHAYAAHWLTFWNDLLRNDYKGTGYVDGGRRQITAWLYTALVNDMHYDQFLRELVTGSNGAEGFVKGIVWRGVVNAAQTPQMQAAQNLSQVFMGVNLKCASCHDSFINQWKLTDSYGLAGVYADSPLGMERCTKPLGKTAPVKFIYPQLGTIDQSAPREKRIQELAQIITSKNNGRLTRTIVNRLWQRLLGRGLIEPVDEMDNKPWNADVLDALAWDLAQHYDLKKTIETIVLSRAYQLPAVTSSDERERDYVFAGPTVRRMSAEQFVDAVSTITGIWPEKHDAKLMRGSEYYAKTPWIWSTKDAATSAPAGTIYLRREFYIGRRFRIDSARAIVAADNEFELFVNGKYASKGSEWTKPANVDLTKRLHVGRNVLAVRAVNTTTQPSPAGLWFNLDINADQPATPPTTTAPASIAMPIRITSDTKWKYATTLPAATTKPTTAPALVNGALQPATPPWALVKFDTSSWEQAVVLGDASLKPWELTQYLPDADPTDETIQNRCSFCYADPLTVALGRPSREQVNTVRPTVATTLQMLELTNGSTLTEMLDKGAKKIAMTRDIRAEDAISDLYTKALGRAPTAIELSTAKDIIGTGVNDDGVADLLWCIVNLPEFQLIR